MEKHQLSPDQLEPPQVVKSFLMLTPLQLVDTIIAQQLPQQQFQQAHISQHMNHHQQLLLLHREVKLSTHMSQQPQDTKLLHQLLPQHLMVVKFLTLLSQQHTVEKQLTLNHLKLKGHHMVEPSLKSTKQLNMDQLQQSHNQLQLHQMEVQLPTDLNKQAMEVTQPSLMNQQPNQNSDMFQAL